MPDNYDYAILIVELFNINSTLNITELEPEINDLNFEEEKRFNSFYSKYKLIYEKKEDTNEMLLFMYKMNEKSNNFKIKIEGPGDFDKTETFDNKELIGSYAFENGESGDYIISFSSENNFEGTFKIVKASEPIKMDINDNIKLNTFNTTFKPDPIIMEFNTNGLGENTYKEFLIGENNNLDLIRVSSGDSEYKNLTLNYYGFEKGKVYKIELQYDNLGDNQYKFDQFIMKTFEFDLEDFKYGSKDYNNITKIQFIKIDLTKFSKIIVKTENDPIIKIAYYNDDLDMAKILDDLVFEDLEGNTITDKSYKKAILMIQLKTIKTQIDFSDGSGKNGEKDEEDDDDNTVLIVLCIVGGVLLLLVIIFLIYRCRKRKSAEPDLGSEEKREELMPQTE